MQTIIKVAFTFNGFKVMKKYPTKRKQFIQVIISHSIA